MQLVTLTLPPPPGFNQTYGVVAKPRARMYMKKVARDWLSKATPRIADEIKKAGITTSDTRPFWWASIYRLATSKDADCTTKLLNDAIAAALGINDSYLGCFSGGKIPIPRRATEHLQVWIALTPVTGDEDFSILTNAFIDETLSILASLKG